MPARTSTVCGLVTLAICWAPEVPAAAADADVRDPTRQALEAAWQTLSAPGDRADGRAPPSVEWSPTAEFVAVVHGGGPSDTVTLRVDPRLAEELERLLEATAIADRLRLRATLRTYALERAAAAVGAISEPAIVTFWELIGWRAPGHDLLRRQDSFETLVRAMREQSYRWLVSRALARAALPPKGMDDEATRTAQRLLDAEQWPLLPLVTAILAVAAEAPERASERWLCQAAALEYAGVRQLRHHPRLEQALARDPVLRGMMRALLTELDELNRTSECGLSW